MRWLTRLRRPRLPTAIEGRVDAWRALARPSLDRALEDTRFVVLDVETSGLDPHRAELLAVGAISIQGQRLAAGTPFAAVLNAEVKLAPSNIVVHGISPSAQALGRDPAEALVDLLEYVGNAPLAAFHAPFDRTVLNRATRRFLGVRGPPVWLDLAWLAPALFPETKLGYTGLDAWLRHFDLRPDLRHNAAGDAFVTGELFLIMLAHARARGLRTTAGLLELAKEQRRRAQGRAQWGA